MIVQNALSGKARFVVLQTDHARMSGTLAEAFGNASFEIPCPRDPITYVATHHDEGWAEVDGELHFDERTGLPYHLSDTPFGLSVKTNVGSPDFNERHHALCGILASMHTCGFYNGRYGLMEPKPRDLSHDQRRRLDTLLTGEAKRQSKLKADLEQQNHAVWAEEGFLLRAYHLLQFFDLLALYFQFESEGGRRPHRFHQVPLSAEEKTEVSLEPLGDRHYRLSPYPFCKDPLELQTKGRYLTPQVSRADLVTRFNETEPSYQKVTLVA